MKNRKWRLTSFQIIMGGFLIIIFMGTFLLMLPVSSKNAGGASLADALFTATSATCVTGLVVQDTATYWTLFGKIIILVLIQIGGMGVITAAVLFSVILHKKIGLAQRSIMQESISASQVGGIVRLTIFIIRTMIFIELAGACLLFPSFYKEYGLVKAIGYSVFHSISAFCNAGFDLMGEKEHFSSLLSYGGDTLLNLTVIFLILAGGIGFKTWEDMKIHRHHLKKYSIQSKMVLAATGILVIIPAVYFYFGEFSEMPFKDRILASLFQTVAPRTAGFNTVNLSDMSETGITLVIILMLIGGASGSTAGGMKMTTVAVMMAAALSISRQKKDVVAFNRRIDADTVFKAGTVFVMYNMLFIFSGLIISKVEHLPILTCLFETSSAIATVGLTLGITPGLSMISRTLLVILMFLGRVGGLTIIFAALSEHSPNEGRYPVEKVSVG
ncbi:MAG: Trk family potassium uptake protein [Lachnospiraceae bacterium]|nr:Trk family potassium uptake protein [Lachnospiraceae bacterium]